MKQIHRHTDEWKDWRWQSDLVLQHSSTLFPFSFKRGFRHVSGSISAIAQHLCFPLLFLSSMLPPPLPPNSSMKEILDYNAACYWETVLFSMLLTLVNMKIPYVLGIFLSLIDIVKYLQISCLLEWFPKNKKDISLGVGDEFKVLFGLLVCVFEGVVGQRCFVACVFDHVVPCDQSLTNGCSPRLKSLLEGKQSNSERNKSDKDRKKQLHKKMCFFVIWCLDSFFSYPSLWHPCSKGGLYLPAVGLRSQAGQAPGCRPEHIPQSARCTPPGLPLANQLSALHSWKHQRESITSSPCNYLNIRLLLLW